MTSQLYYLKKETDNIYISRYATKEHVIFVGETFNDRGLVEDAKLFTTEELKNNAFKNHLVVPIPVGDRVIVQNQLT